jgi:hypothetical protein
MGASTTPTLSRELFPVYANYKRSTNFVIKWLTLHSEGVARVCLQSVGELRYLANGIISSGLWISSEVLLELREAIKARKLLTSFYRRKSAVCNCETDETHEYFTQTFEDIYKELQQAHGQTSRRLSKQQDDSEAEICPVANKFEYLCSNDSGVELNSIPNDEDSDPLQMKDSRPSVEPAADFSQGPAIAGDVLEELASLDSYLAVSRHALVFGLC